MKSYRRIFARRGETCTCENGHPIFDFARNVYYGTIPADYHTTRWRQKRLKKGDTIPNCQVCGGKFCTNRPGIGMLVHFKQGWRGVDVDVPGPPTEPPKEASPTNLPPFVAMALMGNRGKH